MVSVSFSLSFHANICISTNAYIQNNYTTITIGISKQSKRASENEHPQEAEGPSIARVYPKYLKLRSRIYDTYVPACVSYDTQLRSNWISTDIVQRVGLKTSKPTQVVQAISQGRVLRSTGQCVSLSHSKAQSTQPSQQEFYVMENAPFDLLFGLGGDGRS